MKRKTTELRKVPIDGGRAMGAEVRDSDPDGVVVVHNVNQMQRRIDALHYVGAVTDDQHLAADQLRDNWELGRLASALGAQQPETRGSSPLSTRAAIAWDRHQRCFRKMGPGKALILQSVVLHDESPAMCAAKYKQPLARLESALEALVEYCSHGNLDRAG